VETATSWISSLLDVASFRDVPFHQPQQAHSKHHDATFSPFVPVLFAGNTWCQFVIEQSGFPLAFIK